MCDLSGVTLLFAFSVNKVQSTHIPVDSSAARMPFPGATILRAMSCSSFFCSGVSAGYWWVMAAERKREKEEFFQCVSNLDDCPEPAAINIPLTPLPCFKHKALLREGRRTNGRNKTPARRHQASHCLRKRVWRDKTRDCEHATQLPASWKKWADSCMTDCGIKASTMTFTPRGVCTWMLKLQVRVLSGLSHIKKPFGGSSRAVTTCKHAHTDFKPDYSVARSLPHSAVSKQLHKPSPPHLSHRRQRGGVT